MTLPISPEMLKRFASKVSHRFVQDGRQWVVTCDGRVFDQSNPDEPVGQVESDLSNPFVTARMANGTILASKYFPDDPIECPDDGYHEYCERLIASMAVSDEEEGGHHG